MEKTWSAITKFIKHLALSAQINEYYDVNRFGQDGVGFLHGALALKRMSVVIEPLTNPPLAVIQHAVPAFAARLSGVPLFQVLTKLKTTREVWEWPRGFSQALPGDYWQVVHARPRQEKLLARDLQLRGVPSLLFLENRTRTYAKSVQTFQVPLLGGYLFAHLPRERRDIAYDTGRVARLIDVADPLRLRTDLEDLRNMINAAPDAPIIVRPELIAGKRIQVISGTFAGCSGVIERRKDNTFLVVNLPILGRSVATQIPLEVAELAGL